MKLTYFQSRDRWTTRAGEWGVFALAYVFRAATRLFPIWMLGNAIAPLAGRVSLLIPGLRRRAMRNLAQVWSAMPKEEQRDIVRDAAAQFARLAIEYTHLDRFEREMEINVQGDQHLEAARSAGRGAILVSAHYGNWEAARLAALRAGCPTGIIWRRFNNRYLTRHSMEILPRLGEPVLFKGRRGMRELVTHVARGGFIMILVDQRNSGAPFLDFLGQPAETVTAAADLAHRTGAALIPTRGLRNVAARRFDVTFEEPIIADNPTAMMQLVNDRIGAWIYEAPDQWLWFHRRWRETLRSRPRGARGA